jgi:hypothetical protein
MLLRHLQEAGQSLTAPAELAPFHSMISERLAAFLALSAIRLLAECRGTWVTGG